MTASAWGRATAPAGGFFDEAVVRDYGGYIGGSIAWALSSVFGIATGKAA